jgi:hypothetical protein
MTSILYIRSKYSPLCTTFNSLLETKVLDGNLIPITVDNKEVRDKILKSEFSIKTVPCILLIKEGLVEKYEGVDAFAWVNAHPNIPPHPSPRDLQSIVSEIQSPLPPLPPPSQSIETTTPSTSTPTSSILGSDDVPKGVKADESIGPNLMSKAMAMQKMRESAIVDDNTKAPGGIH